MITFFYNTRNTPCSSLLKKFLLIILCVASFPIAADEDEALEAAALDEQTEPLFVSLGSDCLPAMMLRHFHKRLHAFPFDWLLTIDLDSLIRILHNDFYDFTNPFYMFRNSWMGYKMNHRLYHIEFVHDWKEDWWGNDFQYQEGMQTLQSKYIRRIERFRELKNYPGDIVFIRLLVPTKDFPQLYWYGNSAPSDPYQDSVKLFTALRTYFPKLNFKLVTVTKTNGESFFEVFDEATIYHLSNVQEHLNWEELLRLSINPNSSK